MRGTLQECPRLSYAFCDSLELIHVSLTSRGSMPGADSRGKTAETSVWTEMIIIGNYSGDIFRKLLLLHIHQCVQLPDAISVFCTT